MPGNPLAKLKITSDYKRTPKKEKGSIVRYLFSDPHGTAERSLNNERGVSSVGLPFIG